MKLSLEKTWTECLRMWKWIVKEWKKNKASASKLKGQWLTENNYFNIHNNCFFCHYSLRYMKPSKWCTRCPAIKVSPHLKPYFCEARKASHYLSHPDKFYQKLLALNRKRKKKKKNVHPKNK